MTLNELIKQAAPAQTTTVKDTPVDKIPDPVAPPPLEGWTLPTSQNNSVKDTPVDKIPDPAPVQPLPPEQPKYAPASRTATLAPVAKPKEQPKPMAVPAPEWVAEQQRKQNIDKMTNQVDEYFSKPNSMLNWDKFNNDMTNQWGDLWTTHTGDGVAVPMQQQFQQRAQAEQNQRDAAMRNYARQATQREKVVAQHQQDLRDQEEQRVLTEKNDQKLREQQLQQYQQELQGGPNARSWDDFNKEMTDTWGDTWTNMANDPTSPAGQLQVLATQYGNRQALMDLDIKDFERGLGIYELYDENGNPTGEANDLIIHPTQEQWDQFDRMMTEKWGPWWTNSYGEDSGGSMREVMLNNMKAIETENRNLANAFNQTVAEVYTGLVQSGVIKNGDPMTPEMWDIFRERFNAANGKNAYDHILKIIESRSPQQPQEVDGTVGAETGNTEGTGDEEDKKGPPALNPPPGSGLWNWMQENPTASAALAALLVGGLTVGLGGGGKRDSSLGLILALLLGAGTFFGTKMLLTPDEKDKKLKEIASAAGNAATNPQSVSTQGQ